MVSIEELNSWGKGYLPGLIGFEVLSAEAGRLRARMMSVPNCLLPTATFMRRPSLRWPLRRCGFGTRLDLPEGAKGFTTIELKSNFLGTATEGALLCEATRPHRGRSTQVWDATVTHEQNGKTLALFRCTQIILYPER